MKLLVIDSDRDLVEMLTSWLKTLGHEVYSAYTVERARSEWIEQRPDIVIMDTTLQDVDILPMCREWRKKHDALIVVVNDEKGIRDEIRCLESGADDYMRKPFFPSQLLAHIRALSRRARSTLEHRLPSIVTAGPISIDTLHNEVVAHGKTIRLTPTESKLLHFLATSANDVCTASQIIAHVWGYEGDGDAGLIKAHIHHLRQKVELDPGNPRYILTVPGVGYTFSRRLAEETLIQEVPRPLRVASM